MKPKTHAEIIARMRSDAEEDEYTPDGILGQTLHSLADELDAAHKREIDELKKQVGNAAKLRKALEKCANMGEQIDCQLGSSDATVYAFRDERCLAHNISECARAALAAPARNCDVLTPEVLFNEFINEMPEEVKKITTEHERGLIFLAAKGVIDTLFETHKPEEEVGGKK